VAWWREYRVLQRERADADEAALVTALADLYAYVYQRPVQHLLAPAQDRAMAMRVSDAWVADGCRIEDPRVAQERRLLVRSYTRLLDAVGPHAAG